MTAASQKNLLKCKIFLWIPKGVFDFCHCLKLRMGGGWAQPGHLLPWDTGGLDSAAWARGLKKCWSWLLWLWCLCYFREYINIHWVYHNFFLLQWLKHCSKKEIKCLGLYSDLEKDFQSVSHVSGENANHLASQTSLQQLFSFVYDQKIFIIPWGEWKWL